MQKCQRQTVRDRSDWGDSSRYEAQRIRCYRLVRYLLLLCTDFYLLEWFVAAQ